MIPLRAKLALAAAACCALSSCLDTRVNVPVSVMAVDKNQNAQSMKGIELTVFKSLAPLDETHPRYARCSGEWSETRVTDMNGRTTFNLRPGDYEICAEEQSYNGEKFKWNVPFKVVDHGLRVPRLIEEESTFVGCWRVEQRVRLMRWEYAARGAGEVKELLLTRNNAMDRTQPPPPAPTPCPAPAASPSTPASPGGQPSPSAQPSPASQPPSAAQPSPVVTPGARRL
jgi:hypothetical protein